MEDKSKVNRRLTFYNGPIEFSTGSYVVDENVYLSSAGATLKNYGFQIISTTNVQTLPAPEDGSRVDLLFYGTTLPMAVKTTGILFNRQTKQDVFTVTLSTASAKESGYPVRLIGEGTTGWWLLATPVQCTTAFTNALAFSSDT
jgi:hypothetical protein